MRTIKPGLFAIMAILSTFALIGCKGGVLNSDGPAAAPTRSGNQVTNAPARSSPLRVGDRVPDFESVDQFNRFLSSGELTVGKGSALMVMPPASSPAARPAFQWARTNQRLLQQQGIELLLLVPETPEQAVDVAATEELRLALVSDSTGAIARALGNAPRESRHPVRPHVYLFGGDGRVHYSVSGTADAPQLILAAQSRPGAPRGSAIPIF